LSKRQSVKILVLISLEASGKKTLFNPKTDTLVVRLQGVYIIR
jgi:hypothetical protein